MEHLTTLPKYPKQVRALCSECNHEFEVRMEHNGCLAQSISSFDNCPKCGTRNDTWLAVCWNDPERHGYEVMDLVRHLYRQRNFSHQTFGPGPRTEGVLDHIRKELNEVAADPQDLSEWADVVLLALDGAWRAGHSPEAIAAAIEAKQTKNEGRNWPDWRTAEPGKAIEHIRD